MHKPTFKIGVFVKAFPEGGGIFQYTLSLLKMLSNIKHLGFEIVLIYQQDGWFEHPLFFKHNIVIDKYFKFPSKSLLHRILFRILLKFKGCYYLPLVSSVASWSFSQTYRKRLGKIDVIFFPGEDLEAVYFKYSKRVLMIHDLMDKVLENEYPNVPRVYRKAQVSERSVRHQLVTNIADFVFTDSELGVSHVRKYYPGKYISLSFPYVASPEFYNSGEVVLANVTEKYNLKGPYLFYPAQFWEYKNHLLILEAAYLLKTEGIELPIVFVGARKEENAEYYNSILRFIEDFDLSGQVCILGYVPQDDMLSFYKNAFLTIMPTFAGPTNLPIIESILSGTPVIASNLFMMPSMIGSAGYVVDPLDARDLAEKLKFLKLHPERYHFLKDATISEAHKFKLSERESDLKKFLEKLL